MSERTRHRSVSNANCQVGMLSWKQLVCGQRTTHNDTQCSNIAVEPKPNLLFNVFFFVLLCSWIYYRGLLSVYLFFVRVLSDFIGNGTFEWVVRFCVQNKWKTDSATCGTYALCALHSHSTMVDSAPGTDSQTVMCVAKRSHVGVEVCTLSFWTFLFRLWFGSVVKSPLVRKADVILFSIFSSFFLVFNLLIFVQSFSIFLDWWKSSHWIGTRSIASHWSWSSIAVETRTTHHSDGNGYGQYSNEQYRRNIEQRRCRM